MTASASRALVQRIADAATAGRPLQPDDAARLAWEARRLLNEGKPITLGLARDAERAERRAHRDELIRAQIQTMSGSVSERARELEHRLRRHVATNHGRTAAGERSCAHCEINTLNGGRAPGFETIRKLMKSKADIR
jgi:hypothetical protein